MRLRPKRRRSLIRNRQRIWDIIALGVKEGPEVGEILTKVFEHYLEEKCPNSKGFLINEARNIISTKSV